MAEKKKASLSSGNIDPKLKTDVEFIVTPQKITPGDLTNPEDGLGKNFSPHQDGYNPHPDTGAYSLTYCFMSAVINSVPDCLLSGNFIVEVHIFMGTTFVDQVVSDVYDHDFENKLFILVSSVDHKIEEFLQSVLNDECEKWFWVAVPQWFNGIPTKFPLCM